MAVRKKINKRVVDGLQPTTTEQIVWDTELKGFGLKVMPSGRKVYFLYYRTTAGKQRKPTIGVHGEVTPDQARSMARQWLANAAMGGDVSGERRSARQAETVADLSKRYLAEYAQVHKKRRSIATDRANIDNHVIPLLGRLKVGEVNASHIEEAKFAIRAGKTARQLTAKPRGRRIIKGGPGIANRVISLLSKMFACAELWGLRQGNPARGSKRFKEERKDRFLDANEIGRLHVALGIAERDKSESLFAIAAIRLLLFTGLRLGEVVSLRWRDLDAKSGILRLADSKTGKRAVPLNSTALSIIASLPEGDPDALVIQSSIHGREIALSRPWHRLRAAAQIDVTANLHCLRHTFASWSVMGGMSLPQVGALLGHRSAQTTLRYADHLQEAVRAYSESTATVLSAMRPSE